MEYHLSYSFFTGLYTANLLGGEFSNCYGQGLSPYEAEVSLKIRVNQLRRKN